MVNCGKSGSRGDEEMGDSDKAEDGGGGSHGSFLYLGISCGVERRGGIVDTVEDSQMIELLNS